MNNPVNTTKKEVVAIESFPGQFKAAKRIWNSYRYGIRDQQVDGSLMSRMLGPKSK